MIRAATLGLVGITVAALALAQTADETEPTVSDLERELFGTELDDPDAGGEEEELVATRPRNYQQHETVMLRALDKITGRSTDFEMLVGEPKVYGSLRIDLKTCYQTPPEEPPLKDPATFRIVGQSTRRLEGPGKVTYTLSTTGWASLMSTITTIFSFSALLIATNQGVQSLGTLVVLGLAMVTIAAFVSVPLGWMMTWKIRGDLD